MASSTAAAVPVHGEAGLYDMEAPLQQHQQHEQLPPPLDNLGEEASTSEEDRAAEQQSYPLGQSHTPLTSIPTLGQALIEGTNIDRKYVHSFLQVLADHSQFSDKYQHYEEDEYERKRKRKLRESERKMFFYAGQGSQSGEAKSSKRRASAAASSTAGSTSDLKNSASKKRRRRDQDRDRVLDKDTRRQMLGGSAPAVLAAFSAAGNLPAAAAAAMSHAADLVLDVDHSPASSSSSPAQTPPSGYGYVDQRAASMPNMLAAGSWDSFGHLHQQQQQSVHHQPQQQQFYAQQQQQQHFVQHQAAGHAMLRQTRVPQQSYQPLQRFHGSSSSASLDYMPQMSPASSLSSSLPSSSSSYQLSSCYSSPSQSPQQPAADGVYVPAYQVHHHQQQQQLAGHYSQAQAHYPPQRPARMAVSLPAEMLSAAYHQHQVHPHHHHHHGYAQSEAMSGLMVGGGASLDVDGDEAWMSSSSSSLSADACPSAAGGELPAAGSESFSSFGPYVDPATGGLVVGDAATAAGHDGGMLACADMSAAAAAAAAAVEHFMHSNLHHQQPQQHEESSPEGQQLQAGAGMDEDWLNSFFSDDCSPTLLGGVAPGSGGNGDNAAACGLDSLFADMENFYGRLVN